MRLANLINPVMQSKNLSVFVANLAQKKSCLSSVANGERGAMTGFYPDFSGLATNLYLCQR
jgi:hypothetical protein